MLMVNSTVNAMFAMMISGCASATFFCEHFGNLTHTDSVSVISSHVCEHVSRTFRGSIFIFLKYPLGDKDQLIKIW